MIPNFQLPEHCLILLSGVLNTKGEWRSPDLTKPFGHVPMILTNEQLANDKLLAAMVRQALQQLEIDTIARLKHEKEKEEKEAKNIPENK